MNRYFSIVGLVVAVSLGLLLGLTKNADSQTVTPVTACGSYSGNLILQNNVSSGGTCITISGNNTTFDGNGKTITAGGDAVYIYNRSNVTIKNFTSNGGVSINGESADGARVENVNASGISIIAADDVTVTGSTFDLAYLGQESSEMERLTFTNNHVEGNANKLVAMRGSGNVPCPGGHTVSGNTFISHSGPGDEPMVLFMWCIANSTFSNNTIQATQQAQGVRVRDGSDNNVFLNNRIIVNDVEGGSFAALNITTGNEGVRPNPKGNIFRDNLIRAQASRALRYQGTAGGNLFERNIFWGNDGTQASSFEQVSQNDTFSYNTFYNSGSGPAIQIEYYNLSGSATTFRNNIFATAGTRAMNGSRISSGLYHGDRNLFYSSSSSSVTNNGTLAQWRSALAGDDVNSVFGNPAFVNAPAGDFRLTAASAARDIADGGNDAGAKQFDGTTPPPPACTPNWQCTAWSACSASGTHTRICSDVNACSVTSGKPAESQDCTPPPPSNNAVTAGTLTIDAPTLISAGFAWNVTGDVNENATVNVEYRVIGASTWKQGLPFLRVEHKTIDGVQPGNLLAGSVFDLTPATNYEFRLTLSDPDGGSAQHTVAVTTRTVPVTSTSGRTWYAMPGTGGGTGSVTDPFRGLSAVEATVQPGDTVILKAGTYPSRTFVKKGTASAPILYRGEHASTVIFDGNNTSGAVITLDNLDYVYFDSITVRNAQRGISGGNTTGIVIRNSVLNNIRRINGDPVGIWIGQASRNAYVCDNTLDGPEAWPNRLDDSFGILVSGQGHVVCHNDVKEFWDNIGMANTDGTNASISIDIYGNKLMDATDDSLEVDASLRNIRVFRNQMANSLKGISAQPVYGGPIYLIRNEIYNTRSAPYKFQQVTTTSSGPSGILVLNNSSASYERAFSGGNWSNVIFKNNLFYGSSSYAFDTIGNKEVMDYNGWSRKQDQIFKFGRALGGEVRYDTINSACGNASVTTDFCAQIGDEQHANEITRNIWVNVPEPVGGTVAVSPKTWDFTLTPRANAVDSAVALPNITDGFSGTAPDRGALEQGHATPVYGVRTTGTTPPVCTPNWVCTAWSACTLNQPQTRTCTDTNNCGTNTGRPAETQSCLINDTVAPTVNFTAPVSGAILNGTVTLAATATDNVGVVGVQFKLGTVNLGPEDTSLPYQSSWNTTTVGNGSYVLTAVARDAAGNTRTATVTVNVNNVVSCTPNWQCTAWNACTTSGTQTRTCTDMNACGANTGKPAESQSCTPPPAGDTTAPSVGITSPSNGSTVSGNVAISATAADNVGVAGVTFYVNGAALWAEDMSAPYSVIWNTTIHTNGSTKSLTAVARDAAGNRTISAINSATIQNQVACTPNWQCTGWSACSSSGTQTRTCTDTDACGVATGKPAESQTCTPPNNGDTTAPSLTSIKPTDTARVSGSAVTLSAKASDASGIAKVEFYVDTTLIKSDATSAYNAKWDSRTVFNGAHTVTVKAYDRNGNVTTKSVTIQVVNKLAITLQKSQAGTITGEVTFESKRVSGGRISRIEFYRGSSLLGTESFSPYTYDWDSQSVKNGYYTIMAKAFDQDGRTAKKTLRVKVRN